MIAQQRRDMQNPTPAGRPPRRILMTADPIGGVWNYVLELARGLSVHGVDIHLATMGESLSPRQRRELAGEGNVTLHESDFHRRWLNDPFEDAEGSGDWLLALEAKLAPDLVHLNGYVHAALPWKSPCLVAAHSCVLSWWQAVRGEALPAGLEPYRSLVAKGLAAADLVVAPTQAMLQSMERLYRPLPHARVINNARSRTRFQPAEKDDFILSVGRIGEEAKNIESLARSAGELPWPVYVAGETGRPEGGAVPLDAVNSLGYLAPESLAPWYGAAAVYALPARYEPFGFTVLEAAQSGCALVLGDIPSLRELWDGAAVFVDPEKEGALRGELLALCADRARLASLGERALERSLSFNASRMTESYLDAYGRLFAGA